MTEDRRPKIDTKGKIVRYLYPSLDLLFCIYTCIVLIICIVSYFLVFVLVPFLFVYVSEFSGCGPLLGPTHFFSLFLLKLSPFRDM